MDPFLLCNACESPVVEATAVKVTHADSDGAPVETEGTHLYCSNTSCLHYTIPLEDEDMHQSSECSRCGSDRPHPLPFTSCPFTR